MATLPPRAAGEQVIVTLLILSLVVLNVLTQVLQDLRVRGSVWEKVERGERGKASSVRCA
jgi:hypothetical protein